MRLVARELRSCLLPFARSRSSRHACLLTTIHHSIFIRFQQSSIQLYIHSNNMKGKKAFARQRICVPPLPSQLEKKCNKTLKREMAAFPISQELCTVVNQVSDSYVKARDDLVDHLDVRAPCP